ncbi:hypothetical protein [Sphingobacterium spiritivorum]|uniref:hypothetical protein n=1 Tax=Sphingobacterium spiritivorum TaxID=258 RepID=UPI003DA648A5
MQIGLFFCILNLFLSYRIIISIAGIEEQEPTELKTAFDIIKKVIKEEHAITARAVLSEMSK